MANQTSLLTAHLARPAMAAITPTSLADAAPPPDPESNLLSVTNRRQE